MTDHTLPERLRLLADSFTVRAEEPRRILAEAENVAAFWEAIRKAGPDGETVEVRVHPNGDWSVYDHAREAADALDSLSAEREAVLEEAARVAERTCKSDFIGNYEVRKDAAKHIADAIRAMKADHLPDPSPPIPLTVQETE